LSSFPDWNGAFSSEQQTGAPEATETRDYLFLQENLVVTTGAYLDEGIVFDVITPEWEQFCREELKFSIPADVLAMGSPEIEQPRGAESAQ
jgi:hypothetical protein